MNIIIEQGTKITKLEVDDKYSRDEIAKKVAHIIKDSDDDLLDDDMHYQLDNLFEELLCNLGYHEAVELSRSIRKEYS